MNVIRIVVERLFLVVFRIARTAFLSQGVAAITALFALSRIPKQDAPPWIEVALRSSLYVSATLFVAGALLIAARRVPEAAHGPEASKVGSDPRNAWPWLALLGFSLVALPVIAYRGAEGLAPLWREIAGLLEHAGFWKDMAKPSQFSGVVMLPIMVALFVPALETAAAFFLVAAPPAMIVLLATRSPRFPMIFAMLVVCQAGLVLAGLLASDGFSSLAGDAIATMTAADDFEAYQAADVLRRAQGLLATTAKALVQPLLGYVAWLFFLLLSRSVGAYFAAEE